MLSKEQPALKFESQIITAKYIEPSAKIVEQSIEIRRNPITGRTCRLAFSRMNEKEPATDSLPQPPPDANETSKCPFCQPQVNLETPAIHPDLARTGRMSQDDSLLFPNLYPYGSYSAVSLFNDEHFVEIGLGRSGSRYFKHPAVLSKPLPKWLQFWIAHG